MGLSLLGDTVHGDLYKAPVSSQAIKDQYHFRDLLGRFASHATKGEKLTSQEEERLKDLGGDCANYLHTKAFGCSSYTQMVSGLSGLIKTCGMPQVGSEK